MKQEQTNMPFSSLGLYPPLLKVLAEQNYDKAYPIQQGAIPPILKKKDVLGIAKTGSGKTASYVLPILTNLSESTSSLNRELNVLVLVPTRELAVQIKDVFQLFGASIPERVKTVAVFGGVAINPQMQALKNVNILVATPGRLLDLIRSNAVNLSTVKTLILDEADKMLNLDFEEEIRGILSLLPISRQNLLFSATLSDNVRSVEKVLLRNHEIINIDQEDDNIDLIRQIAIAVPEEKKGPLLRYLINEKKMKQVLVFTSSGRKADNVARKLSNNGIDAEAIHSKKKQGVRTNLLTKFKYGKLRVLVATDLLSRGIDIEFLPCVINYELPRSAKDYVHRIGRTGRAGQEGEAISFITPEDKHHFRVIQKKTGIRLGLTDCDQMGFEGN